MLDRLSETGFTVGRGLKWALIAQAVVAVCVVLADLDARWLPRLGGGDDLQTGPVSPGDQVRRYDPVRTRPGFTNTPNRPDIALPDEMPDRLQFDVIDDAEAGQVLLITGAIDVGDDGRLAAFLASEDSALDTIALHSPGGIVAEALLIGRRLKAAGVDTMMLPGMVCLSACPYILAAGETRRVSREAAVGLHQHYYDTPGYLPAFLAVEDIQHGQGQTMAYLIEIGIDPGLMLYSLNTPPDEIYLLVEEELLATGLATDVFGPT